MSPTRQLYIEVVRERVVPGPRGITMSEPRDATPKDIAAARKAHRGRNPHMDEKTTVFYDETAFIYDLRRCGICDEVIARI